MSEIQSQIDEIEEQNKNKIKLLSSEFDYTKLLVNYNIDEINNSIIKYYKAVISWVDGLIERLDYFQEQKSEMIEEFNKIGLKLSQKYQENPNLNQRENDLLKAITIMNNSFKSGRSIMQSIELVSSELDSPLGLEFKKMYVDLNYGLSLDVVFKRFEERVKVNDAKYITTSLTILNETGGNIVKVFESVEKTFFNNKKLKDELNNLTAASKFLYYVLLFIPIVFIIFIYLLDNTYFNPLFNSSLGILIVITCLILYITYIIVIKRIMKMGDYHE